MTAKPVSSLAARLACLAMAAVFPDTSHAGAAYTLAGTEFREEFDQFPVVFSGNSNIQNLWPTGWKDDSPTEENVSVGIPGWFLHYPLLTAAEGGANGHQRLRFGAGANTGSFWAFGTSSSHPEKALGSVGSTTVAANGTNMLMALCLVNETGGTLTQFTVTYDGEQWRDGQSAEPETLRFGWSLEASVGTWSGAAVFTPEPALDFTGPFFTGTGGSGAQVNGNTDGLTAGITGTVTGISWAPGAELWLRWEDPQLASNADDGLAIDNFVFTATGGGTPPATPEDPKLALVPVTGGSGWQLQWTGQAGVTTRIQHGPDLAGWTTDPAMLTESAGLMTWPLPGELAPPGRVFFRLRRTSP